MGRGWVLDKVGQSREDIVNHSYAHSNLNVKQNPENGNPCRKQHRGHLDCVLSPLQLAQSIQVFSRVVPNRFCLRPTNSASGSEPLDLARQLPQMTMRSISSKVISSAVRL
jgi:hypothetical protein